TVIECTEIAGPRSQRTLGRAAAVLGLERPQKKRGVASAAKKQSMPKDIKHRLERARQAVASWLPHQDDSSGRYGRKRISTPQLVKRTLHVSYDSLSGTYQGVPQRWLPEFNSRLLAHPSGAKQSIMSFASLPASSVLSVGAAAAESTTDRREAWTDSPPPTPPSRMSLGRTYDGAASAAQQQHQSRWSSRSREFSPQTNHQQQPQQQQPPQVWFDRCTRRFVNLPPHWRERLQRNNLTEWSEFQRNPALLTTVFTMMDEELRKMDLSELGLDSSVHSSVETTAPEEPGPRSSNSTAINADSRAVSTEESNGPQPPAPAAPSARSSLVWRQQRSFVRDDDSDSEEFVEI
uniref:CRIB domain-containing protein n=1 Tax=Macrostomum lignano TaxID=282301 RepID=A0A1I8JHG2_9PLAT